ncbi:hypothetical protein C8J57DRAFT_1372511 [Mycena rebaudengoi]|nr:hypothetical protein C8J57DRAFT_1372511 [Mycena rebaudengoi]
MTSLWGYKRQPYCILPLFEGKPYLYYNEDQRNVHVWMSTIPSVIKGKRGSIGGVKTLRLLAGAWAPPPDEGLPLPRKTFYGWMRYICYPIRPGEDSRIDQVNYYQYDQLRRPANKDFRLLYLGDGPQFDPRLTGLPANTEYAQLEQVSYDEHPMKAGHYILVAVEVGGARDRHGRPSSVEQFIPCEVGQELPAISQRSVTKDVTVESSSKGTTVRSASTKTYVRLRDRRCRITGLKASGKCFPSGASGTRRVKAAITPECTLAT